MQVDIEIKGVRETINNITEFGKEADRQLGLAMAKVVFKITEDAKIKAPFATGFLRSNIIPNVRLTDSSIIGTITSKAPYSVFQEFGTSRHSSTPFMRPAINKNINFIQSTLGKALRTATFKARKIIK